MPDWTQVVRARLGALGLTKQREAEIVAEIASHLEDLAEERTRQGASEADAVARALAAVPDWRRLSREIGKEAGMNQRMRTLWLPGVTMAVLAMGDLIALGRGGLQPRILWLGGYDGHAVFFYLPWLLLLLLVGAIGAFWSRRVGGGRAESALAALFPVFGIAALLLLLLLFLPISVLLGGLEDQEMLLRLKLAAFGTLILSWVVVPGLALLLGALPFVVTRAHAVSRPGSVRAGA